MVEELRGIEANKRRMIENEASTFKAILARRYRGIPITRIVKTITVIQ